MKFTHYTVDKLRVRLITVNCLARYSRLTAKSWLRRRKAERSATIKRARQNTIMIVPPIPTLMVDESGQIYAWPSTGDV